MVFAVEIFSFIILEFFRILAESEKGNFKITRMEAAAAESLKYPALCDGTVEKSTASCRT